MPIKKAVNSFAKEVKKKFFIRWSLVFLGCLLCVFLAASLSKQAEIENLQKVRQQRLDIYVANLESTLDKYKYLPFIVSLNKEVVQLLSDPSQNSKTSIVNHYLQEVNKQAQSSAIYILDTKGLTLASSNWNDKNSFVGQSYSFRPYFRQALQGKQGRFYGIGATSQQPGYFLSYPIYQSKKIIGVVVAKVSLNQIEETWRQSKTQVIVTDANSVIFLTSVGEWKFRALDPLSQETSRLIDNTRQYNQLPLTPINITKRINLGQGSSILRFSDQSYRAWLKGFWNEEFLAQTRVIPELGWKMTILSEMKSVKESMQNAVTATVLAYGFLVVLLMYLRQRRRRVIENLAAKDELQRAHDNLERKVSERTTDLVSINTLLQKEIIERKRAEQVLREAQDELVQASKLAVLGQMSAGIAHELNQPLAALRMLSDNALTLLKSAQQQEVFTNLNMISELIERMGRITGQLKAFARKTTTQLVPVSVSKIISNSLILVEQRVRLESVTIKKIMPRDDVFVLGDEIRLEQVLINLFRNGLDAMQDCTERYLEIIVEEAQEKVMISVRDTGSGIPADVFPHIFSPFCTTKGVEAGLGLGLAISSGIIRECGGVISAENRPDGGAQFLIVLLKAS